MPTLCDVQRVLFVSAAITLACLPSPLEAQRVDLRLGTPGSRLAGSPVDKGAFGLIQAAAFVPSVGFVAVDVSRPRLHLIGLNGRLLATTGRGGSGPGEMREPASVALLGRDTVVVLDRALQRLSFVRVATRSLTHVRSVGLKYDLFDICSLDRRFVALGYTARTGRPLHFLSGAGDRGDGWGDPFFEEKDKRAEALVNEVATIGRLACAADAGFVIVAPKLRGIVQLYDRTGALRWQTDLVDYVPTNVRMVSGGGVLFGRQPGQSITDNTVGLVLLSNELVLVQTAGVSKQHPGGGFDYAHVVSRLLRVSDGKEIGRSKDLPIILAAGEGRVLTAGSDGLDLWIEVRPFTVVKSD